MRTAAPEQIVGAVLLAFVLATAVWRVGPAFRWVDEQVDGTRGLTRLQREVNPAHAVDIDVRPIERAAQLIPPDARFAILVSDDYPVTHEISRQTLPAWAAYRLLPRRRVTDVPSADWVISYGANAELPAHGVLPTHTIDLGLGVTLVRVR